MSTKRNRIATSTGTTYPFCTMRQPTTKWMKKTTNRCRCRGSGRRVDRKIKRTGRSIVSPQGTARAFNHLEGGSTICPSTTQRILFLSWTDIPLTLDPRTVSAHRRRRTGTRIGTTQRQRSTSLSKSIHLLRWFLLPNFRQWIPNPH